MIRPTPLRRCILLALFLSATLALCAPSRAADAPTTRPASPFDATRVTLHLKDAPPRETFAALAAASGIPLTCEPADGWAAPGKPTVSVDAVDEPFWKVFRSVADQAGAAVREFDGVSPLAAHHTGAVDNGPACDAGPFALVTRDPQVFISDTGRHFSVPLAIYTEPKLTLRSYMVKPTEATDDRGRSLRFKGAAGSGSGADMKCVMWLEHVALDPDAWVGGKEIAVLRGTCRIDVNVNDPKPLEIDPIAVGRTLAEDVTRLTIRKWGHYDGGYNVAVDVTDLPASVAPEDLADALSIVDAEGRALECTTGGNGGTARLAHADLTVYRREGVGPPAKLLWLPPSQRRVITVPFEFHHLPLP